MSDEDNTNDKGEMISAVIDQAVRECVAAYAEAHLKGFEGEGEVLEQEKDWCNWLKENAPGPFAAHLLADGRFSTSIGTLQEWFKPWIEDGDNLVLLTEEWREDYNWQKKGEKPTER